MKKGKSVTKAYWKNTFSGIYTNFNSFIFKNYKTARLLKSFEFGNGGKMSDENLVILEFKYLQNKKW